jgi:hypothetical protein
MYKYVLVVLVSLLMTACKSDDEKRAVWLSQCQGSGFTVQQCAFLLAQKSDSGDDSAAMAAAGFAVGMASTSVAISARR